MSRYDDLFDELEATDSVFADKRALDPLSPPDEVLARPAQERQLARILNGVHDGYLPTTVSIYGPPGTGKTSLTRAVCTVFAARTDRVAVAYVNLKECRTIFAAANEILYELTGDRKDAYVGLDGVFTAIWDALGDYPEWTILLLDEIDHVQHDANYDINEFFYRLLRGEGKLERGIQLSAWFISNELLTVDLRVDSRVESVMSGEEVFFPPYDADALRTILTPRLAEAFIDGAMPDETIDRGIRAAAERWGDARKALRLFRQAGEYATERELDVVTVDCIEASLGDTDREATIRKLQQLPLRHLAVLAASVGRRDASGEIIQPVRVSQIHDRLHKPSTAERFQLTQRSVQRIVDDLATMGLVDTWTASQGRDGRAKYVETTFDPAWVQDTQRAVATDLSADAAE